MMKKLVFATNNPHKLDEIRAIAGNRFEILSLADINCHDDIPETAPDLTGNALIKARWVRDRYGFDCFADDTGLMVDALAGRPGVYSARYAGPECSPDDNMRKLLHEMKDLDNRRAHFETVIALCLDGKEHTFSGRVDGAIAKSRHGSAGFGYDPIFIPDMLPGEEPDSEIPNTESLSFAEIPAGKKNAISHRGKATRALMAFLFFLLAIILPQNLSAYSEPSGTWTFLPSIGMDVNRVFSTPDNLFLVNYLQPYYTTDSEYETPYSVIFRYDKKADELSTLTKNSGLAAYPPTIVEYNPDRKYLFIGYEDGNIDLLYDNGRIVNLPVLTNADNIKDKKINSVTFAPEENHIYVATNFGYFIIDDRKNEIVESKIYRVPLNSVAKAGRYIIAADTAGVVHSAPIDNPRISWTEFSKLPEPSARVYQLLPLNGNLCGAIAEDRSARVLMLINPDTPEIRDLRVMYNTSLQFAPGRQYFIGSSNRGIMLQPDGTFKMITIPEPEINSPTPMASLDLREFWFVDSDNRFYSRKRSEDDGTESWSNPTSPKIANGPIPFRITDMVMHPKYGILVSNHGKNTAFDSDAHPVPLQLSAYKDGAWTQYGLKQRMPEQMAAFGDPNGIAIDPDNQDVVYLGSMLFGMFRMNLADKSSVIHWSRPDPEWKDLPGFVKVHDAFVPDWPRLSMLSYPVIDNKGNLWVIFNNFKKQDINFNNDILTELWVLTADQRRATTSAASAKAFTKIPIRNLTVSQNSRLLPLNAGINNNLLVYTDGAAKSAIVVIDHKGTPANASDDRSVTFKLDNLLDSEGATIDAAYITALFEDQETGLVWVGTESGLFSFSPTGAIAGNPQLRQFKIARNDGTGLADYLLANVKVFDIIADKRNRKWISTKGAGLICVAPDGTEVITECNTGNSDIPSDVIYKSLYLPEENAIMLATSSGLVHYQPYNIGDGTDFEYARAYPNPVRPDYLGYVTIDGLADNALVKISDAHGHLVRELGFAANGLVRWDVCNMHHQRVGSGVYFVLASTGPDDQSLSKVTKILVVN